MDALIDDLAQKETRLFTRLAAIYKTNWAKEARLMVHISEKQSLYDEWTRLVFRLDYTLSGTHLIHHLELITGKHKHIIICSSMEIHMETATISSITPNLIMLEKRAEVYARPIH